MVINLSNVHFSYPEHPKTPVLNIKSWSLTKGEHAFIYGPSGCGKSTLLSILTGLLYSHKGNVTVLNQRLDKMSQRQRDAFRAKHIGYVFQQFNLVPYLNAIENIQLASYFSKSKTSVNKDIEALLITLNLEKKDWVKPVRTLSIGQQQRIAIARALINKPSLLIADEPTSSLDQENRNAFMALLMSIVEKNHITLLFVSHDMSLAHYFTRVESLNEINQIEYLHAN